MTIYEALIQNDGTIFRLVFGSDSDEQAEAKARDSLVAGDVLMLVRKA